MAGRCRTRGEVGPFPSLRVLKGFKCVSLISARPCVVMTILDSLLPRTHSTVLIKPGGRLPGFEPLGVAQPPRPLQGRSIPPLASGAWCGTYVDTLVLAGRAHMHAVYPTDSIPSLHGVQPLWQQPTGGAHQCPSGAAAMGPEAAPKPSRAV